MTNLLAGLVAVLVSTNPAAAASNLVRQSTGGTVTIPNPNDPVERAYQALLELDDAAQTEVDRWIREADQSHVEASSADNAALQARIDKRLEQADKAYRDFLVKHPGHVHARVAYGSFCNDTGRESDARHQWEMALDLNPQDPAIYNNLAGIYGHRGPVKKAFPFYEKAIALNPREPVYFHNFGTTVFLFRRDAMEHYGIDEQRVFDKALALYAKAEELDPANFILATDVAQTYYGIKPARTEAALTAWNRAMRLAHDDLERQSVFIHIARVLISAGRFAEARTNINQVTRPELTQLKHRVERNLERRSKASPDQPPPAADKASAELK